MLRWALLAGLLQLLVPALASAASFVYSANENASVGTVSTFSVASDGALTQLGTGVTSGSASNSEPQGVAVSPNGHYLYATNYHLGTVSAFSIAADGTLTQLGTGVISGTGSGSPEPVAVAVAPNGQYLYVANYYVGTVSTFAIAADGTLTQQGTGVVSGANTSSSPYAVAVSPSGQYLYVANVGAGVGSVSTFSIAADGALTQLGTGVTSGASTSSRPFALAVSPNGQYLFAANEGLETVSAFSIAADGALTQLGTGVASGTSTPNSEPWAIAVTPSGQYLYVANFNQGTVSAFSIAADGTLTQLGTGVISGTGSGSKPDGVAVSPNGQYLYVSNYATGIGSISTFSIAADGTLTQLGTGATSGANTGGNPAGIVVSPDVGPSAAFSATLAQAGAASSFTAQTSSAGGAAIASYGWQFSDGANANGESVSHVFATPGVYTVTLTLTDSDSCSLFGPFTGQTAFCTLDPAASTTQTVTIPGPGTPSIGTVKVKSPKVTITVSCAGTAIQTCAGTLALTTLEHLTGHKITAISAAKKPKKTSRSVTLGSATYALTGTASTTFTITLNKSGKQLLAKHHKLPAKLTLTPTGEGAATTTKTLTIKPSKAKHKHHA